MRASRRCRAMLPRNPRLAEVIYNASAITATKSEMSKNARRHNKSVKSMASGAIQILPTEKACQVPATAVSRYNGLVSFILRTIQLATHVSVVRKVYLQNSSL